MERSRSTLSRWNAGVRALLAGLAGVALVQCGEPSQPTELGAANPNVVTATASGGPFAYVTNSGDHGSVSVIDLATNTASGSRIEVGPVPVNIAITPDGTRAYVANYYGGSISVIDLATNTPIGSPLGAGWLPWDIAITPDGARAYVTTLEYAGWNERDALSVFDLATNELRYGVSIGGGDYPGVVEISPDGARAYVASSWGTVTVVDVATNVIVGDPIAVGIFYPVDIAITPDGARAYVLGNTMSVIDLATSTVIGSPIAVGNAPASIAITPDGGRAVVTNYREDGTVSVIALATNTVIGAPIPVGSFANGVAITSDGARAYVTNSGESTVSVIDLATNRVIGAPIAMPFGAAGIAITRGRTLTPAEQIGLIKPAVAELLAAGSLSLDQARALRTLLDQALTQLAAGHTPDALRRLQRFVTDVNRLIREGVLTPAEGQPLLDNANGAIFLLS